MWALIKKPVHTTHKSTALKPSPSAQLPDSTWSTKHMCCAQGPTCCTLCVCWPQMVPEQKAHQMVFILPLATWQMPLLHTVTVLWRGIDTSMRPGIVKNVSCVVGNFCVTSRPAFLQVDVVH